MGVVSIEKLGTWQTAALMSEDTNNPEAVHSLKEVVVRKTIQIPDGLVQLLGPEEQLSQTLVKTVILELFQERRISAGKAAEL